MRTDAYRNACPHLLFVMVRFINQMSAKVTAAEGFSYMKEFPFTVEENCCSGTKKAEQTVIKICPPCVEGVPGRIDDHMEGIFPIGNTGAIPVERKIQIFGLLPDIIE